MNIFKAKVAEHMFEGLRNEAVDILQINVGRRCNLACKHCHLRCSPERKEIMPWSHMELILNFVERDNYRLIDVTGGSPEFHPEFRRFVKALRDIGQTVQIRTNLAALIEPELAGIIDFLRAHEVHIVGSLPCYLEENVRAQRGLGVYQRSIAAIRRLNELDYGVDERLQLNLVYNPGGTFLPGRQSELEVVYRRELGDRFGISFSELLVLANMPIGRFADELQRTGMTEEYMRNLQDAFNPATLNRLMCRYQVCIDWDGRLYDCDFNLALGLHIDDEVPRALQHFDRQTLEGRRIATSIHCFGCTAGAGSSCKGALVSIGS
jgi:radical SAM/Cys-rich protein